MEQHEVLFVGGPWDGRQMVLPALRPYFPVNVQQSITIAPVVGGVEGQVAPSLCVEQFVYKYLALATSKVYVPMDWMDNIHVNIYERTLKALTRGYVGRP